MANNTDLSILYEDNHYIIINKKSGDLVQADKTQDVPLSDKVAQYLKEKYNKTGDAFVGVVHRIDRPVSGVVLFAKTSKGLSRANTLFATQEVTKTYWAIVQSAPHPAQDRIIHWLLRKSKQNKSYAYPKEVPNSKKAILSYRIAKRLERYVLLEVSLETGRHHQIRSQLSAMGCPIKGDLKYGAKRSNLDGSISLHARTLQFTHPIRKEVITITAPPPKDALWKACI